MTPEQYSAMAGLDDVGPLQTFLLELAERKTKPIENFSSILLLKFSAVANNYQNRGITGKMADWVIAKAKEDGIPAILSESTGLYSQAALVRRGFECISEIKYSEYKDENGELVFKHTAPHISIKMLLLVL